MGRPDPPGADIYRAATGIVTFLGLYQGAVPLVVRGIFDRDQRFAPGMWLPSPWWWITCFAIVAVAIALLAALASTRKGRYRTAADRSRGTTSNLADSAPGTTGRDSNGAGGYGALAGVVFLAGIYNGVAPFVARLVFDGNLLLAFPLRLPAPWWWITSLVVIATTAVLLALIDNAQQRRHAE